MRARYSLGVLLFLVGLVVAAALLPTSVSAQLAANEVYALQTFSIAWTHDGVNTNVYRYFRNNVQVGADIPVASRVNGEVVVQHTGGLAVGSYTLRLDAIGDGGTGRSADFVLVVKALPTAPVAPTLPRIIRVTP